MTKINWNELCDMSYSDDTITFITVKQDGGTNKYYFDHPVDCIKTDIGLFILPKDEDGKHLLGKGKDD